MSSIIFWSSIGLALIAGYGIEFIRSRCRERMNEQNVNYSMIAEDEQIVVKPSLRPPFPEPNLMTIIFSFISILLLGTSSLFMEEKLPINVSFFVIVTFIIFLWSTAYDLLVFRLPDALTIASLVSLFVAVTFYSLEQGSFDPLLYATAGGLMYALILFLPTLVLGSGMLGFGDIKISTALGFLVGMTQTSFVGVFMAVLLAALVGSILGSLGGITTRLLRKTTAQYPFGPYIIFGAAITFLVSL